MGGRWPELTGLFAYGITEQQIFPHRVIIAVQEIMDGGSLGRVFAGPYDIHKGTMEELEQRLQKQIDLSNREQKLAKPQLLPQEEYIRLLSQTSTELLVKLMKPIVSRMVNRVVSQTRKNEEAKRSERLVLPEQVIAEKVSAEILQSLEKTLLPVLRQMVCEAVGVALLPLMRQVVREETVRPSIWQRIKRLFAIRRVSHAAKTVEKI